MRKGKIDYSSEAAALRHRRRLRQPAVAKYAGLNVGTLTDIENGRVQITRETYERLANAIKIASKDEGAKMSQRKGPRYEHEKVLNALLNKK